MASWQHADHYGIDAVASTISPGSSPYTSPKLHLSRVVLPQPFTEGPAEGKTPAPGAGGADETEPSHERNVSTSTADSSESKLEDIGRSVKVVRSQNFELSYPGLPMRVGFAAFGGLRVLLVGDRIVDEGEESHDIGDGAMQNHPQLRVLKE